MIAMKPTSVSRLASRCVVALLGLWSVAHCQPLVIELPLSAIVYDPVRQVLYGSMKGDHATYPNSLVKLNPGTLEILDALPIGSEPGRLAISDTANTLYAGLNGSAPGVVQIDLDAWKIVRTFELGTHPYFPRKLIAKDIKVQPGTEEIIAVGRGDKKDGGFYGVVIVDSGKMRKNSTGTSLRMDVLAFDEDPTKLYGANTGSSLEEFTRMVVDESGVTVVDSSPGIFGNFLDGIDYFQGLVYSTTGRAIDSQTLATVGSFPMYGYMAIDEYARKAFFLANIGGDVAIRAGDLDTFVFLDSRLVPSIQGSLTHFLRWGKSGFAWLTFQDRICTMQSSLAWKNVNVPPTTLNILRGTRVSGGNPSLAFMDNQRLVMRPGPTFTTQQWPVDLELIGFAPDPTSQDLNFTIESHGSANNIRQIVSFYDNVSGQFVAVDNRNLTTVDRVIYVDKIGNAANFIDPADGKVRAKITYRANGPVLTFPWEVRLDVARWSFPQ